MAVRAPHLSSTGDGREGEVDRNGGDSATGCTIRGMPKTTLYLSDDLKRAIELEARRTSTSEAEVVRRTLSRALLAERPRPRGALFRGNEPIAARVDELLEGFGQ